MSFSGLFSIGLSALSAFSAGLEAVSSNIANSQTTGYKRIRTDFSDLLPNRDASLEANTGSSVTGTGVTAISRQLTSEQGSITRTNTETNAAISGDGFFIIAPDATGSRSGDLLYTRAGDFTPDTLGNLVNSSGYYLQGAPAGASGAASTSSLQGLQTININRTPAGADPAALGALTGVSIDKDGVLSAAYANGETHALYRIPLALFSNEECLDDAASTSFRATTLSGKAQVASAGAGRAGSVEGSALEISTVDIGQEFSTLISTQRAYATNARIISTADELWQTLVSTAA